MDWNDVRHFLALARSGSIRAAGASLGVSHSTVARRVDALESKLATKLFDRHRGGYLLTDAGRQMLPGAVRVETEMLAMERDLVGRDERLAGPISVTCFDDQLALMVLDGLLPMFAEHPGIEPTITTDTRSVDLSKREADIALRAIGVQHTPPVHLLGRKLVPITIASYVAIAHADHLDPAVEGSTPRWVGMEDRSTMDQLVASSSYPDAPIIGQFSSYALMIGAALSGLGLVMLPTYVGDAHAELKRVEPPDTRHLADVWLLSHADLRDNARLREARRRISAALESRKDVFVG